jgi:tetratricopeptide (TPR) repeat protein
MAAKAFLLNARSRAAAFLLTVRVNFRSQADDEQVALSRRLVDSRAAIFGNESREYGWAQVRLAQALVSNSSGINLTQADLDDPARSPNHCPQTNELIWNEAKSLLESAQIKFQLPSIADNFGMLAALSTFGQLYMNQFCCESAIIELEKAKQIAEATGYEARFQLISILAQLGEVYKLAGELEKATEAEQRAQELTRSAMSRYGFINLFEILPSWR